MRYPNSLEYKARKIIIFNISFCLFVYCDKTNIIFLDCPMSRPALQINLINPSISNPNRYKIWLFWRKYPCILLISNHNLSFNFFSRDTWRGGTIMPNKRHVIKYFIIFNFLHSTVKILESIGSLWKTLHHTATIYL
jgi:hypothetical protein